MKFSVIVPVYKIEEPYLRTCLGSLKNQTYNDCEFIIVDDGSPDNCGAICDEYAISDSRFRIFHLKNQGVSFARNYGLSVSTGDYIIFVDGDDFIEQNLCKDLSEILVENNPDIVFFKFSDGVTSEFLNENRNVYIPDSDYIKKIRIENVSQRENRLNLHGYRIGAPWGKAFKNAYLQDNGIAFVIGLKKSQDRIFMFDCLEHTNNLMFANINGYNYVLRENSVTHRYNANIHEIIKKFEYELSMRVYGKKEYDNAVQELFAILLIDEMMLNVFKKQSTYSFSEGVSYVKKLSSDEVVQMGLKIINPKEYNLKRRLIINSLRYRMFHVAGLLTTIFYG